ncbi:hypothetical protein GBW32_10380 [Streptomyces tsukubensis]|nr:hypothetical protein GBW32_10380 [Streptomyces tsukubensis]
MQPRVRTAQQTPERKARYAVRSGVESRVREFSHGLGIRHCRDRGQGKAHVQHPDGHRRQHLTPQWTTTGRKHPHPTDQLLYRTTSTDA